MGDWTLSGKMDPVTETAVASVVRAFIATGSTADKAFDEVARQLFAYQYACNAPYRRYCDALGMTPANVAHWTEIPPAPAAAFKSQALSCTPPEAAARVFHSSGTTGRATSRHYLSSPALALYDLSLRDGFTRFVLPDGARLPIWALMPPLSDAPHSSLSYMVDALMAALPHPGHRWFWRHDGPDVPALAGALAAAAEPVIIFGTAFAWAIFLDESDVTVTLPVGSRILETGGFKGRSRTIPREELYTLFRERLGVPEALCLAEYGMSEMCSQFYDSTLVDAHAGRQRASRKVGPHWVRTRVLDPATGNPVPPGEPGVLCHYDLANLNSVLAICTEDLGRQVEDGFELLGRATGAVLRGCSLTAEEWHARR